jgi:hypothetical protein
MTHSSPTASLDGWERFFVLLCVSVPSFMINLDANIVAVSLPSIARSLNADFAAGAVRNVVGNRGAITSDVKLSVGRVRSQQMAKMPFAEHDNVVKTFPPDRTDRPFAISVLPRRSRRGWPIPNAHRPKAADEDVTVDGVAVTNDVSRRYFPTIGLGELVRDPFSRWVRGHSQPQDLTAIVMQ